MAWGYRPWVSCVRGEGAEPGWVGLGEPRGERSGRLAAGPRLLLGGGQEEADVGDGLVDCNEKLPRGFVKPLRVFHGQHSNAGCHPGIHLHELQQDLPSRFRRSVGAWREKFGQNNTEGGSMAAELGAEEATETASNLTPCWSGGLRHLAPALQTGARPDRRSTLDSVEHSPLVPGPAFGWRRGRRGAPWLGPRQQKLAQDAAKQRSQAMQADA
mmetsp:Transcript_34097/g.77847  ORF Transcript_34097/g.77847 Transcript_34097/m.77847 type:complete len:214 (-) Transcript_34097:2-643(-)